MKSIRLRSWHVLSAIMVVIFGTIAATTVAGVWKTEGDRVPQRFRGGSFAGMYDPADIRGSYAFTDIEAVFGIPTDVLGRAFGLTAEEAGVFAAKDLEERYGAIGDFEIGTDSLRLFVALYLGLPYTPEPTTILPQNAYRVLVEEGISDVAPHESGGAEAPRLGESAEDHEPAAEAGFIRGRTTFAELLTWGLSKEQVEEAIGAEMPARGVLVRDYATGAGLEFGLLRTKLQELLDAAE